MTPWTAVLQASLSFTNSRSLPKLMSIESVMTSISFSVVPFSSCHQSFLASGSFALSQFSASGGQSTGVSALASFLPKKSQADLLQNGLLSHVQLFATPCTAARQASLSITNSQSLPKPMSIESVMPSSPLILCHPLLVLPPVPPSIRIFSNESAFHIRWPKYWSFSFKSVLPMNTQD